MTIGEEKRRLHTLARSALEKHGAKLSGPENWTGNLFPGISAKDVEAAYSADPEWRQDLAQPHSSAALTVNLFAPWKATLEKLPLGGETGFTHLTFEVAAPLGLDDVPAYFDAFATSPRRSVAIEVKCLEYLSQPSENYRTGFERSIRQICESHGRSNEGWLGEANLLDREPEAYGAVFAHQLVKQAFALAHRHASGRQLLFYLFWEPADWRDHPFFGRHRSDLARLAKAVAGERIGFAYQSVSELIKEWSTLTGPDWLADHRRSLRARYEGEIGAGSGG